MTYEQKLDEIFTLQEDKIIKQLIESCPYDEGTDEYYQYLEEGWKDRLKDLGKGATTAGLGLALAMNPSMNGGSVPNAHAGLSPQRSLEDYSTKEKLESILQQIINIGNSIEKLHKTHGSMQGVADHLGKNVMLTNYELNGNLEQLNNNHQKYLQIYSNASSDEQLELQGIASKIDNAYTDTASKIEALRGSTGTSQR